MNNTEHGRLVEKGIYDGLSANELTALPDDVKARARDHFRALVADGLRSGAEGGWVDGPEALAEMRAKLTRPSSGAA